MQRLLMLESVLQADASGALEAVKAAVGALPQVRQWPWFLCSRHTGESRLLLQLACAIDISICGAELAELAWGRHCCCSAPASAGAAAAVHARAPRPGL